jgi:tetratricopeptide (TPR) repeat protein
MADLSMARDSDGTLIRSLYNVVALMAFRSRALRELAARRAIVAGPVLFASGFLAFVLVRQSVYSQLEEVNLPGGFGFETFFHLNLVQALLFLALVYIPTVVCLGNAVSGFGFSVSRQEYRAHFSGLLPLWGILLLLAAPLQWFLPQFLVIGIVGISVGLCALSMLILIYTVWAIAELGYLSPVAGLGVFALSWITLPVFYVLTTFLFALPLFLLLPLFYLAVQRMRNFFTVGERARALEQNLKTLTLNPQDADAHHQLGLIHLGKGHLDAAQSCFQNAVAIDPEDPGNHFYLGRVFEKKADWSRALEQFETTYRLSPNFSLGDIFREVGKGYLQTGHPDKAAEFLRHFLEARVSDPEGRFWLAVALQHSGDMQGMRVQLNTILDQARSNPRFFTREHREWIYRSRSLLRGGGI